MSLVPEDEISTLTNDIPPLDEKSGLTDPSDAIPPCYSPSTRAFATVSLHMHDKIRFVQFPVSEHPKLLEIITSAWSNGIQTTREYAGSYEMQLKGSPWMHRSSGMIPDDNHARRLIRLLLEELYKMGWVFETAVRLCKKSGEKDTLLFTRTPNITLPTLTSWFMISYDSTDLITIQRPPPQFSTILSQRLNAITTITTTTEDDSTVVLKLKGNPWLAQGEETMHVRAMFLAVRETLEVVGWHIYATFRMMNGSSEGDVLVCCKGGGVDERREVGDKGELI